MNICPCCGEKLAGEQSLMACGACGARAVGPPLARPEHELPSYVRALAIGATGALLLVVFLIATVAALVESQPFSLAFWNVVAAGETAAWRLKLLALPLALVALWPSWRALAALRREPARFGGLRVARAGLAMSAFVVVASATLIGITVPERLHKRALAAQAAQNAVAYEISGVLLQYQTRYGTYPATANDLRTKLDDTDGSVARVVELLKTSTYEPVSDIAALPAAGGKGRAPRRAVAVRVRNAPPRAGLDDTPSEGLSFTSYKLVLPGPDKKLGTADDITLRDGALVATPPPAPNTARATQSSNAP